MKISQYTSFFHDGEIIDIRQNGEKIEISMKSAEIDPNCVDDLQLTKDNRLTGILHIDGVKCIINNGEEFHEKIKMLLPNNDILHLKIKDNLVVCEIGWWRLEPFQNDFSCFEISAEKIWWENIPDLFNPLG
jgi:hypothetical protein